MKVKSRVKGAVVVVALVGCVLLVSAAKDSTFRLGQSVEVLVNMMRNINLFYVDDVESDKIMKAAAEGMTKILDPYSVYLSPESMEDFDVMTTGKYGGLGSMIRQRGEWVEFSLPYEGSPADRAGIRPGDKILKIDGKDAKGMTSEQVSSKLKGDPGTTLTLELGKFPTGEPQKVKITREIISIPGVRYHGMVAEGVGYIDHNEFTVGCSNDLLRAYEELRAEGMTSLIIDYRSNGGGVLQEAVKTLALFLPAGSEVVSTRSSKSHVENKSYKTESKPIAPDIPLVVLTSNSSASAAEIVAGALQDHDRAVVVGQRTYGKGLVQSTFQLGYGAYAKLTTSKYYLPSGRCIQAIDYAAHNDDGSYNTIPDSLISEFKTRNGRKVYDGGGIMPDRKLEPEYVSSFAAVVYAQGFVDDFLNHFCALHYDRLEGNVTPEGYHFTEADYEEFIEWMSDKEVLWESYANTLWKEFKKAAEKQRWKENMDEQIALIEKNLNNNSEDNLRLYEREMREIIENEIVRRYCYTAGGIVHYLKDDNELKEAIAILSNPEEYARILAEQDTAKQ